MQNLSPSQQQQLQQQRFAAMYNSVAMQQQQQQQARFQPFQQASPMVPGAAPPTVVSPAPPFFNANTPPNFAPAPGKMEFAPTGRMPPNVYVRSPQQKVPVGHTNLAAAAAAAAVAAGPSNPAMHPMAKFPMAPPIPPQLSARTPATGNTAPPPMAPQLEATPVQTEVQKENLKTYQTRDRIYQETLNVQSKRHHQLAHEKKKDIEHASAERRARMQGGPIVAFGPGYGGYRNGKTGLHSRLVYPQERKRLRHAVEFKFPLHDIVEQAKKEDTLVPIRIEMEVDGYKLRDTFTWNLNETLITPEQFAEVMCEDLRLPPAAFVPAISRSIKDQVQDYYLHASSMVTNDESEEEKERQQALEELKNHETDDKESLSETAHKLAEKIQQNPSKNTELRTLIKLDITVENRALLDQFEWDISCSRNSPESFAETLVTELGLGGEFKTAIAHSIREQIHVYIKSLLLVGHEFDGPVTDDDLRGTFLPSLKTIVRDIDTLERFTPALLELTDAEIDKMEKDRMRDARRKRRQTRGRRGIILPDREPLKTHRTNHATPHEQEMSDEQFLASVGALNSSYGGGTGSGRGNTPVTYEPMHSQRRSALKARMNIAAEAAKVHVNPHDLAAAQPGIAMQGILSLNNHGRYSSMSELSGRTGSSMYHTER
ncbi:uncharacterized protein BYT42DRAFT_514522 [Radiomyces spectabilis]|uniref:uncharacterized protein n=1 Tax=Radiomyces spectabilis TaxID=64574 RepID=UPI00221E504A|nr:uncharacterized protein BYT42DRAFT_514522 [Radiomyces spectabilis]KAI8379299.1 hypothetical protein BYT42DRAFT_514522 [Radiomyces spectabilis]